MRRGEIWWANLREPLGSEPGYRRPVLVVSINALNESLIQTVLVVVLTTNLTLAGSPGNVSIPASASALSKDSVVNVSQVVTVDKGFLSEYATTVSPDTMAEVNKGLRLVLGL